MRHHADKKTSAIFAAASPFSAAVLASSDEKFPVKFKRANLGTAPRYRGGFSAPTIKSAKGWIAALLVDESPDVKNLPVAPKDETEFVENFPAFQIGFKSRANFPTSSHWEWKAQWLGILRRPLRTAHKDRRLRRVCAGRQARRHDPLRYAHRRRLREEAAQNRQHKAARTLQTRHGNKSAQRLPARVSLKPPKPAGGTGSRRSYPSAAQRKQTYRRPPYGGSFFSYYPRANGRKKKIPPPKPKKNLRAGLKRHKRASLPAQKISAHNGGNTEHSKRRRSLPPEKRKSGFRNPKALHAQRRNFPSRRSSAQNSALPAKAKTRGNRRPCRGKPAKLMGIDVKNKY